MCWKHVRCMKAIISSQPKDMSQYWLVVCSDQADTDWIITKCTQSSAWHLIQYWLVLHCMRRIPITCRLGALRAQPNTWSNIDFCCGLVRRIPIQYSLGIEMNQPESYWILAGWWVPFPFRRMPIDYPLTIWLNQPDTYLNIGCLMVSCQADTHLIPITHRAWSAWLQLNIGQLILSGQADTSPIFINHRAWSAWYLSKYWLADGVR